MLMQQPKMLPTASPSENAPRRVRGAGTPKLTSAMATATSRAPRSRHDMGAGGTGAGPLGRGATVPAEPKWLRHHI
eukprot:2969188-Heterocapsa_arctica.AAC.1